MCANLWLCTLYRDPYTPIILIKYPFIQLSCLNLKFNCHEGMITIIELIRILVLDSQLTTFLHIHMYD